MISPLTRRRTRRRRPSTRRRRPLPRSTRFRHRFPRTPRGRRPRRTSVIIRPPRDRVVIRNVYHPVRRDWVLDGATAVYRTDANLSRITRAARNGLRQRGLLRGVWPTRLAQANDDLIRFINRFYRVAGFEYVVQDYFGSRIRERYARKAIRYARRLAKRLSNIHRTMSFERSIRQTSSGKPILSFTVKVRGRRYRSTDIL